ncbi:MAG: hypothetical protein WBP92_16660 [Candidatus Acidiferrales bacterium]
MFSIDVIAPFAVLALIIFMAVSWYVREGRNPVLEDIVQRDEFGSPRAFSGTLSVEREDPGHFLRLSKNARSNRWLQFRYRWLGMGKQAIFDEVDFDGLRGVVATKRGNDRTETRFPEFSAIRMREVSGGKGGGSLWHVELIQQRGSAVPFVTSEVASRPTSFKETAAVAKAVSKIMLLPVQVHVAGNIWTPGWPPKSSAVPS